MTEFSNESKEVTELREQLIEHLIAQGCPSREEALEAIFAFGREIDDAYENGATDEQRADCQAAALAAGFITEELN